MKSQIHTVFHTFLLLVTNTLPFGIQSVTGPAVKKFINEMNNTQKSHLEMIGLWCSHVSHFLMYASPLSLLVSILCMFRSNFAPLLAAVPLSISGMGTLKANLTGELRAAREELAVLSRTRDEIECTSNKFADNVAVGGFVLLSSQAGVLFNWTYINFDWNLVEPITYLLGYSVVWMAIFHHFFFGTDFSYDNLRRMVVDKKKETLIKSKEFDIARYAHLEAHVAELEKSINELASVDTPTK